MKNIGITIGLLVVLTAGIFGGVVVALPRVDTYLKLKAFDDCAKASAYTYQTKSIHTKDGEIMSTSVEPVKQFYVTCITDKGYTTQTEK